MRLRPIYAKPRQPKGLDPPLVANALIGFMVVSEAVHKVEDGYVVKMPDPDDPRGKPIDRPVEVGLTDGRKVVVHGGLEEGEKFYVKLPIRIGRDPE